ncbi:cold shock domain-containing protein, partial [Candidatus Woesearchaeota archaeon]|nr:cold shock domain-containing protein [Candidatus Woesearchaeota archaeon]
MEGKVKFFNKNKGFGFITADDGKDYFVHLTGVAPGTFLRDEDPVTFDVEDGERGPKAVNVALSEGGASAPAQEADDVEEDSVEEKADEDPVEEDPVEEDPVEEEADEDPVEEEADEDPVEEEAEDPVEEEAEDPVEEEADE